MADVELNWAETLKKEWASTPHEIPQETWRVRRLVVVLSLVVGAIALFDVNPRELSILGVKLINVPIPLLLVLALGFFAVYYCFLAYRDWQLDRMRSFTRNGVRQWEIVQRDEVMNELGIKERTREKLYQRIYAGLGEETLGRMDPNERNDFEARHGRPGNMAEIVGRDQFRLSTDRNQDRLIWEQINLTSASPPKRAFADEQGRRKRWARTKERAVQFISLFLFCLELIIPIILGLASLLCYFWPRIVRVCTLWALDWFI